MRQQQYPTNSSEPQRLRPIDYSRYLSDGTEWVQGLCGLVTFFIAYAGWYPVARRLPAAAIVEGPRDAWLMQLGWAAVCLAFLLVVDLLARSRWGWDRFRVGLVLGLSAVAGFWIVRLAMTWPPAAAA
jgi:hypothetical protein